jgi:ATP/maltotriose-dependent transcriptional regulator MalT
MESGYKIVEYTSAAPRVSLFINREKDLELLKKMASDRKAVVIFGVKGIGKTALASKYIEILRGKQSLFWYQLDLSDTLPDILDSLAEFLELMGVKYLSEKLKGEKVNAAECLGMVLDTLSDTDTLLVFDGYHEPGEDVVEFFYMLVNMLEDTRGVKVLITSREDIPFYNWFYSRKEIERRTVGEIHLKGLDRESGKKILSIRNIEDDAYKQIYQLTKGVPQLLEYVRDNDSDALNGTGLFTAQEIRLMLGLKGVVKK